MARVALRDRDVDALLGVLEVLSDPCSVAQLRQRAVEAIPTVVSSSLTAWNEVDPVTGLLSSPAIFPAPTVLVGGSFEAGSAIFAANAQQHPVLQHFIVTGDGRPYAISDFCSQGEFHGTRLYQDFYRVLGVEDQTALQLPAPWLVVAITLHQEWHQLTDRDRLLLNLLRPQLVQGYRNAHAHDHLQRMLATIEQRVETAGEGLVLLDRHHGVDYASHNAREILARWLGAWRRPDLPSQLDDWMRARHDARLPKAPPWPLMLQRHGRQLTIRRLPTPEDDGVALLIAERDLTTTPVSVLARLGLTPRQSQVLDLAMQGCTNAQIGAQLSITTNTVEAHMTHALAKLGVDNRTAAANLIHQAMGLQPTGEHQRPGTDPAGHAASR